MAPQTSRTRGIRTGRSLVGTWSERPDDPLKFPRDRGDDILATVLLGEDVPRVRFDIEVPARWSAIAAEGASTAPSESPPEAVAPTKPALELGHPDALRGAVGPSADQYSRLPATPGRRRPGGRLASYHDRRHHTVDDIRPIAADREMTATTAHALTAVATADVRRWRRAALWGLLGTKLVAGWGTLWDIQWHIRIGRDSFWMVFAAALTLVSGLSLSVQPAFQHVLPGPLRVVIALPLVLASGLLGGFSAEALRKAFDPGHA